jgi:hypothetical protein
MKSFILLLKRKNIKYIRFILISLQLIFIKMLVIVTKTLKRFYHSKAQSTIGIGWQNEGVVFGFVRENPIDFGV